MKSISLIVFAAAFAIFSNAATSHGRGFGGAGRGHGNFAGLNNWVGRRTSDFGGNNYDYGFDGGGFGGLSVGAEKFPRSYNPLAGEQAAGTPQENGNAQRQSLLNSFAGMGIRTGGFRAGQFGPPPSANHDAADFRVQANAARANFHDYNAFGRDWLAQHPGAWSKRGYARCVWAPATWSDVNAWLGGELPLYEYTYGKELTYEGDKVCLDGRQIATAGKYYESAVAIAQAGERDIQAAANWLPLGVFEAIPSGDKSSKMLFQLAVNKEGTIRGNYFDPPAKNMQLIQGAVDKDTERAAWVVADRKNIVFDCVLSNLTKSETPVLAHMGEGKPERWVLIRLNQPTEAMPTR
jgi:hypothetical protein